MTPLERVVEVRAGGGAPQDQAAFTAVGHPFVRAGSLVKLLAGHDETDLEKLDPKAAAQYGLTLFPTGTVLFAKSGMSATKGHVYRLRRPSYVVNHLAALVPSAMVDGRYLMYALREFSPTRLIKDSAYPSIRLADIAEMRIPLPPLAEQRRIAEILDRADGLRAKRRAALAQISGMTSVVFTSMLEQCDDLTTGTLDDVADLRRGPFGGALRKDMFAPSGYKVYEQGHAIRGEFRSGRYFIDEQKFAAMQSFAVREGDLIVSCSGTIGRVAVVPPDAPPGIINQALLRVRPRTDLVTPAFLGQVLTSRAMKAVLSGVAHGTGLQNFPPMEVVRSLAVPIPPLPWQGILGARLAAMDRLQGLATTSMRGLDALFASLQHRAFRGEL
jgi:type I restriction enzyme S subunit